VVHFRTGSIDIRQIAMRSWRLFIVTLVFVCIGVACTDATNSTPTAVANSLMQPVSTATRTLTATNQPTSTPTITLTPTVTPTKTPSPTPRPTEIPAMLGAIPQSFSISDVSAISGNSVFQITQMRELSVVGNRRPAEFKRFIEVSGYVYNYGTEPITLHDVDFEIIYEINGAEVRTAPLVDLLAILKETERPDLEYPDRNIAFFPDFVIPPKTAKATTLIYELDESVDLVRLAFIADSPNLSIIVVRVANDNEYLFYKVEQGTNGQITFTIDPNTATTRISEVLDVEEVEVDNCFGSTTITRSFTFSQEAATHLVFEEESAAGIALGQLPVLGRFLQGEIRHRHQNGEETRFEESRTESLSASPKSKPRWELTWYLESISGVLILSLGNDVYEVPYRITDRLRSDLVSVPSESCS
jgi:hypothetical protein